MADSQETKLKAVAKSRPVPLYHQIYLLLRDEIISGQRPTGALVPTEEDLARLYGVSRITTRRALDELALNKLVVRRRRVGTRVIFEPPSPPIVASIDNALDSLITLGRNTKAKLVALGEEEAAAAVKDALDLKPNERVQRAVRVRWLDDLPLVCIVSYVPSRLGAFTHAQLESTPILSLIETAGVKIGKAGQVISASSADAELASLLDIEIRAPILRIVLTVYSTAGEPILYTIAQYRSDRYQIRLDLLALKEASDGGDS